MRNLVEKSGALALALVLLGAGCGPAAAPGPTGGSPASVSSGGGNECDHPYFPSGEGHLITYRIADAASGGPSTYTMTVTERTRDGFTASYDFEGDLTVTQRVRCDGGELRADGVLDLSAALGGAELTSRVTKVSGVFLPETLAVGTRWESSWESQVEFGGAMAGALPPGMDRQVTVTLTAVREVVADEEVTTPAGSFRAAKVRALQTTGAMSLGPVSVPPQTSEVFEWWVRGVGLVKTSGDFGSIEAIEVRR